MRGAHPDIRIPYGGGTAAVAVHAAAAYASAHSALAHVVRIGIGHVSHARGVKLPLVFVKIHFTAAINVAHCPVYVDESRHNNDNNDESGNSGGDQPRIRQNG